MGFFGRLLRRPESHQNAQYLTAEAFQRNLAKQKKMSPLTVKQLRKFGVTDSKLLKLEFFFYTNAEAKAKALEAELEQLAYEACSQPAGSGKGFLITGWTSPMKMDETVVVAWTDQMCTLGMKHDCKFDGWGTCPE